MTVDHAKRHTGSWTYIQRSTRHHQDKWRTNNLWSAVLLVCGTQYMLLLGVNSWWWYEEIDRDDTTLCSVMMVEVVNEKEGDDGWTWRWGQCGRYKWIWNIRGTICLIWLGKPGIFAITCHIFTCTCRIEDGKLTLTPTSLKSYFFMMFCLIYSQHSPSHPQLYYHLRIQSYITTLYLSMPWSGANTEYSKHRVQNTPSTAYTEYIIQPVQLAVTTAFTMYCIIPRSTGSAPTQSLSTQPTVSYSILYIPGFIN